jgi:hypothetical protein
MTEDQLTEAEKRVVRGLGITPESYLARKAEMAKRRGKPAKADRIEALRKVAAGPCAAAARERIDAQISEIEKESE